MVAVGIVAAFLAGLAIAEYYNRRIQRIIERGYQRPTQQSRREGLYTPEDLEMMRAGYRVGKRTGKGSTNE